MSIVVVCDPIKGSSILSRGRATAAVVSGCCQPSVSYSANRRRETAVTLNGYCSGQRNGNNVSHTSSLNLQFSLQKGSNSSRRSSNCRGSKIVSCQGGFISSPLSSRNGENSFCEPSSLAPLALLALVFSKAATFMASLRDEIVQRRLTGERAEREFCEAAEKNLPWKPEMMRALARSGGISMALLSTTALAKDHLTPVLNTLRANPTFMSGLIAWALAQVMKIFTYYVVVRKWDFRMVMGSGGMPSSHSALCFALTTSVALVHGVADGLFPVCLGFTLIVMYDAAGVRRHAGKQAEILNIIVADMFQGHPISERKLKELLGHTPLQVFAGAALGILVGYLCSQRA